MDSITYIVIQYTKIYILTAFLIIVSGFSDSKDLAELSKQEFSTFIAKPYQLEELSQIIAAAIQNDAR